MPYPGLPGRGLTLIRNNVVDLPWFIIICAYTGSLWYFSWFYGPGCCSMAISCSKKSAPSSQDAGCYLPGTQFHKIVDSLVYLPSKTSELLKVMMAYRMSRRALIQRLILSHTAPHQLQQFTMWMNEARQRHCNVEVPPLTCANPCVYPLLHLWVDLCNLVTACVWPAASLAQRVLWQHA